MSFSVCRKSSQLARNVARSGLSLALTLVSAPLFAQPPAPPAPPTPPLSTTPTSPTAPNQAPGVPAGPSTAANAQGAVALRGTVADPDSAEIPGATITLTPASGQAITSTSGPDGTFAIRGVPPGVYSITITMPGFASFVRDRRPDPRRTCPHHQRQARHPG